MSEDGGPDASSGAGPSARAANEAPGTCDDGHSGAGHRGTGTALLGALRCANAGVWTLDLENGGGWWSRECFWHHGQQPDSFAMTVKNWIDRFHPDDGDHVRAALARATSEGTEYSFEYPFTLPDGSVRWLMDVGNVLEPGHGAARVVSGITLDVSERARARAELAELLAERERGEAELRAQHDRRDRFLALLGNELRNPLAALRSSLGLFSHEDDEKRATARDIVFRQLDEALRIVDDLSDITRISQGVLRLQKSPVDLREIVELALESERPVIDRAGITLETSLPPRRVSVEGDHDRLVRCLVKLLDHAAKSTPAGGRISVALGADATTAQIVVVDGGRGISEGALESIFDLFPDDADGGAARHAFGLGLAGNLAALHGGTVSAQRPGADRGSQITMTLPVHGAAETAPASPTPVPPMPPSHHLSILVVDDNADAAQMLALLLEDEGHDVTIVHSGEEAITAVENHAPQVVILDIGLPGCDGYEVARALRKNQPNVTLLAVTGHGLAKDVDQANEAGFDHHLLKPVDFDDIKKILGSLA